jgi:hypothetical protein
MIVLKVNDWLTSFQSYYAMDGNHTPYFSADRSWLKLDRNQDKWKMLYFAKKLTICVQIVCMQIIFSDPLYMYIFFLYLF